MKKLVLFVAILLLMVLACGCISMSVYTKVKGNGDISDMKVEINTSSTVYSLIQQSAQQQGYSTVREYMLADLRNEYGPSSGNSFDYDEVWSDNDVSMIVTAKGSFKPGADDPIRIYKDGDYLVFEYGPSALSNPTLKALPTPASQPSAYNPFSGTKATPTPGPTAYVLFPAATPTPTPVPNPFGIYYSRHSTSVVDDVMLADAFGFFPQATATPTSMPAANSYGMSSSGFSLSDYNPATLAGITLNFYLEMPGKIVESNANTVDGNKAEWHVTGLSGRTLYAKSEVPPSLPISGFESMLAIVGILAAGCLLAGRWK